LKSGTSSPKPAARPNGDANTGDALVVLKPEPSNLRDTEVTSELPDAPKEKSILKDVEVDADPAGGVLNIDYSLSSS
jgi:hypothetical protein